MEYRTIYITVKDEAEARQLSFILVEEKLAACVNYFPIKSVFRWKGKIEESEEQALIVKTRAEKVDELIARVKEVHFYEVPCIVSWKIEKGNSEYLDWIKESTE
jgi:periplasmic divalent cation tolerance protein